MSRYTPNASEAMRRRREADSAASGSTHTTYHGSAQLSVASSATLAQPHAAMASPRRHAETQHASSAAPSAALKRTCSVLVSPPAPTIVPTRLGLLRLVASRLSVVRRGRWRQNATRLAPRAA